MRRGATVAKLKDLLGKTMASVENGGDELVFTTTDGKRFRLYHSQGCCEYVRIESVVGDLNDLVGEPLLVAEESTGETPADYRFRYAPDSYTWTFYKFATRKGYVDVRWLGESNGYYSESVDFAEA
jgi:hypothetical protein